MSGRYGCREAAATAKPVTRSPDERSEIRGCAKESPGFRQEASSGLRARELVIDAALATEKPMSVYYIAEHIITDPVKFEEYRIKVAPMIASYGGRYITRAGSHKFPESPHWKPERVVIIEFPDMERLNAWYTSAGYQPLMALRKESTDEKDMVITVEGA
jgi:uncharacterized protein (DUF1330 family)